MGGRNVGGMPLTVMLPGAMSAIADERWMSPSCERSRYSVLARIS
jgi:hypothetical protein